MKKHSKRNAVFYGFGVIFAGILVLLISGYVKTLPKHRYDYYRGTAAALSYPDVSFAVISDIHVYDPSLGVSGAAFEETMNSDRKLLLDSIDLLDYALEDILASGASFVLVAGDLTKDGELINHQLVASKLKKCIEQGIGVYVVPGNHDINNPGSVRYAGDDTMPETSVSAEDFAAIYGDFGFGAALARDPDSLSYVAEPAEGLWLLALDACRYRENIPGKEEIVSGRISQKTADWIASMLRTAMERNKAVMVMMHHGIVEHWKGQAKLHPDYLVQDYSHLGRLLASHHVRLAFTGHYHAQDISLGTFGDGFLYDIETGALVTAPCPIRYGEIRNNALTIRTKTIVDQIHPGTDFAEKAHAFVKKTVMLEAIKTLTKFKTSDKDADYISDAVGDAFSAHYAGDENPALRPAFDTTRLGLWGRFIYATQRYVLDGLWNDLPPADNNVRVELGTK